MKMCHELQLERKKSTLDANEIQNLSKSTTDWKQSKSDALKEMKALDDETNRSMKSKCDIPCKIMNLWFMKDIENIATAIEIENAVVKREIDPDTLKDVKIRNEWDKRE